MLRIALIDGDVGIRSGRKLMIDSESTFHLVYEESDAQVALEKLPELLVDVLVIDHRLKGFDGLQLASKLVNIYSTRNELCPPIIITGTYATPELVLAAIRCGASDVVTQDAPMSELLKAIRNSQNQESLPDFSAFDEVLNHSDYRPIPVPLFVLRKSQLNGEQTGFLANISNRKSLAEARDLLGLDDNAFRHKLNELLIALNFATPEQLYLAIHDAEAKF